MPPFIIAGPCSAETRSQTLHTARELAAAGVTAYRAGLWKPRTKPGGFEGVGAVGLEWLREVKETTGMAVSTEVATPAHVESALNAGIDFIWIGARTTANPFAVQEIADALKGADIPVWVKNPAAPDLELWIGAIERLRLAGVNQIGAIHRGFSSYAPDIYRNDPLWRIPIELRRRMPGLPVISDPSHIGGKRELIASISQQALDMGFNGLIIESHIDPDSARSDRAQQVTPSQLKQILDRLIVRSDYTTTENIDLLRRKIDRIDNEILEALSRRMAVSREIGQYKKEHGMSALQTHRYDTILQSRVEAGRRMQLSPEFIKNIVEAIHQESVAQQIQILNKK